MRKLTTAGTVASSGVMCFILILMLLIPATTVKLAYGADSATSATALAGAELYMEMNGAKIPINLVSQDLKFPQLIPYFGPENPGWRFRPLEDILLYADEFPLGELQKGLSDKILRENQMERITDPEALKQTIKVIYNKPKNGENANVRDERYKLKGYVGARAFGEATSLDAFYLTCLLANKRGAKVVHVTRQGVDFSMEASGYGLSLGGVSGTISDSAQSGAIATGMIGWSKGKAESIKNPWVQGVALEPLP